MRVVVVNPVASPPAGPDVDWGAGFSLACNRGLDRVPFASRARKNRPGARRPSGPRRV